MDALYAFMRHTDDLADATPADSSRREALAEWRAALHEALEGGCTNVSPLPLGEGQRVRIPEIANCKLQIANCKLSAANPQSPIPNPSSAILPALADVVERFHIPCEHLDAVIDGVEMDLDQRRYETFDELRPYCQRVASAVGLACIHVWGFRGPEAFEPARQAGIALQLTNILRDLKQDAEAGRIYLPLADLRECGYSVDDLLAGVDDQRFRRLMVVEIARTEQFYRGGAELWNWLEPDGRRVFGLMMGTYRALLREIARNPAAVLRGQIRLSRVKKLQLLARWSLLPPRLREGRGKMGEGRQEHGQRRLQGEGAERLPPPSPFPLPPSPHVVARDSAVAIVGGGLAGLAAAVAAVERGWQVELFERAPWLGGRAGSFVDSKSGQRIDYCRHVAMGCCTSFLDFCRRTGIADCFDRTATLHFIGPEGTRHDFTPSRWLPAPLHLLPGLWRLRFLSPGERWEIISTIRRLCGPHPSPLPEGEGTIGAWLCCQGQSDRAIERFWSPVVVGALGETVDRASLAAAQKVFRDGFLASRRASDLVLPRLPLGEIFHDRLGDWLARHGVKVHLATPVRQIEGGDVSGTRRVPAPHTACAGYGKRAETVVLADGTRRTFDAVIVAVPWHKVRSLLAEDLLAAMPALGGLDRIEPAAITAVHLWFDRPITSLPHAVLVGRLGQWMFSSPHTPCAEPANGVRRLHYCQVVISASHRLAPPNNDELLAEVRSELEVIWPAARTGRLLHSRVVAQPAAVFSCVPGLDGLRPPQQTPIENLALAGDWTATGWPATMEGAIRSGFQAVKALVEHAVVPL
jgi:squalene-associated FAD-dependent desaturase